MVGLSAASRPVLDVRLSARARARSVAFQMAEVAIALQTFQEILRLIAELLPKPPLRQQEADDIHATESA